MPPGAEFSAALELKLDEPWHMYSMTTPKGGPIITTITLDGHPAIASWEIHYAPPKRKFDPNFGIEAETYEKETVFQFVVRLKPDAPAGPLELAARMRYQLCNEKECLPPRRVSAAAQITVDPGAPAPHAPRLDGLKRFEPAPEAAAQPAAAPSAGRKPETAQPLGAFLVLAFGFGLAAIFTPCVFPMIPITMTFFLSQGGNSRAQVLKQAMVFCLGIIVLFTGIAFGLTDPQADRLGPRATIGRGELVGHRAARFPL